MTGEYRILLGRAYPHRSALMLRFGLVLVMLLKLVAVAESSDDYQVKKREGVGRWQISNPQNDQQYGDNRQTGDKPSISSASTYAEKLPSPTLNSRSNIKDDQTLNHYKKPEISRTSVANNGGANGGVLTLSRGDIIVSSINGGTAGIVKDTSHRFSENEVSSSSGTIKTPVSDHQVSSRAKQSTTSGGDGVNISAKYRSESTNTNGYSSSGTVGGYGLTLANQGRISLGSLSKPPTSSLAQFSSAGTGSTVPDVGVTDLSSSHSGNDDIHSSISSQSGGSDEVWPPPSRHSQDYAKVNVHVLGQPIDPSIVNHLNPDVSPIKARKLRKILAGSLDEKWMSEHKPRILRQRGVSGDGNSDDGIDMKLEHEAQALNLTLRDAVGAQFLLPETQLQLFRKWLVQKATCEMEFVWEDLGPLFWPRWIRRGVCLNRPEQSCSWPTGMQCRPSGSRGLQLLHWKCEDNASVQSRKRAVHRLRRRNHGTSHQTGVDNVGPEQYSSSFYDLVPAGQAAISFKSSVAREQGELARSKRASSGFYPIGNIANKTYYGSNNYQLYYNNNLGDMADTEDSDDYYSDTDDEEGIHPNETMHNSSGSSVADKIRFKRNSYFTPSGQGLWSHQLSGSVPTIRRHSNEEYWSTQRHRSSNAAGNNPSHSSPSSSSNWLSSPYTVRSVQSDSNSKLDTDTSHVNNDETDELSTKQNSNEDAATNSSMPQLDDATHAMWVQRRNEYVQRQYYYQRASNDSPYNLSQVSVARQRLPREERRRKRARRLIKQLSVNTNGYHCYWQVQKYLISDKCTCSCS